MNFTATQLLKIYWKVALILLCAAFVVPIQQVEAQDVAQQVTALNQFKGKVIDSQTNMPLVFCQRGIGRDQY